MGEYSEESRERKGGRRMRGSGTVRPRPSSFAEMHSRAHPLPRGQFVSYCAVRIYRRGRLELVENKELRVRTVSPVEAG